MRFLPIFVVLYPLTVLAQNPDPPPTRPAEQRQWLLAHIIVDMQMQGQYDATSYQQVEKMINNQSDQQIGTLIKYYQLRHRQVEQAQEAEAVANLRRLEAYRDHLKREFDMKMLTFQQERDVTNWTSNLAREQFYGSWGYGGYGPGYWRSYHPWNNYPGINNRGGWIIPYPNHPNAYHRGGPVYPRPQYNPNYHRPNYHHR